MSNQVLISFKIVKSKRYCFYTYFTNWEIKVYCSLFLVQIITLLFYCYFLKQNWKQKTEKPLL